MWRELFQYLFKYWYVTLLFAVLAVIAVIIEGKFSARRHERTERELRELQKEKELRQKYASLTPELLAAAEMPELLEGVTSNIQGRLEKEPDMTKAFNGLPVHERYIYTLNYFICDTDGGLSGFFRKNGEPLTSLAPEALKAVGSGLWRLAGQMSPMFDNDDEENSYDEETAAKIDAEFSRELDLPLLYELIKKYIIANFS